MELGNTEGTTLEDTMSQIKKFLYKMQPVQNTEIKKQTKEAIEKRDQEFQQIAAQHNPKIKKTGKKKDKPVKEKKISTKRMSKEEKQRVNGEVKENCKRKCGDNVWVDETLNDWLEDDYRIFAGDLGNEVSDEHLAGVFRKYHSFMRAKVIRDKRTGKTKGYGFVSFANADDYIKAFKENDGRYLGKRPLKLMRSKWKNRTLNREKLLDK